MEPGSKTYLLGTVDIAGFHEHIGKRSSAASGFSFLDTYYKLFGQDLASVRGTIIKYMGDCILFVLEPDTPDALKALRQIHADMTAELQQLLPELTLTMKLHIGEVCVGKLGHLAQIDIVGAAVNELFLLPGSGFVVSETLESAMGAQPDV